MSTGQVLRGRFPRSSASVRRYGGAASRPLDEAGKIGWFAVIGVRDMVWALTRYRNEILRLIAEVGMGTGAMAIIGGTAVIIGFVTLSAGSLVAIQGLASLGHVGLETLLGFVSAFVNVRLVAPIVTSIALAATVGAGATAELGAMRISEEIDALEVMGVKSTAYLVSTRMLAGLVVIIPLYAVGLILSFFSPQVVTTLLYGQTSGTYEHYFRTFLRPDDVFWSFVEVIIIAAVVMLSHCYYGYNASGGPVGVGEAVGRSMRSCWPRWRCTASIRTSTSRCRRGHDDSAREGQQGAVPALSGGRCGRFSGRCARAVVGVLAVQRGLHREDPTDDAV
jgi:phospholipid/cholesterol/gamma-HCH transport system permease protein